MRKRLLQDKDGRDVHLHAVPTDIKSTAEWRKEPAAALWSYIEQTAGDGLWHKATFRDTRKLKRVYAAVRNRAHYAGLDNSMIQIYHTELDGVCWRWAPGGHLDGRIPAQREDRLRAHRERVARYRGRGGALTHIDEALPPPTH